MKKQSEFTAIIVAAGTGKRMNSSVKKQYMEIAGFPVLYHTINAFEKSMVDDIIIVTGEDEIEYVTKDIVEKYEFKKVSAVCRGGKERCDSVYEGVKQLLSDNGCKKKDETEAYVLIHDGVRPLITPELINSCIESVKIYGACIPGVSEKDTVKEADENMEVARTPDRKKLYRIQTPQCFCLSLIREAFEKFYDETGEKSSKIRNDMVTVEKSSGITDDAMLVEKFTGHKVKIIKGDYENIKITTPEDIGMAEYLIKNRRRV